MKKPIKPKRDASERLVIPGDWKDAVKTALSKTRPASGWPKRPRRTKKRPA